MNRLRVVSVSGGKDSTATLLLAMETNWLGDVRAVFADTGNEHPATMEYLAYLSDRLGIAIETVRADFTRLMAGKRAKLQRIVAGEPEIKVFGARETSNHWTAELAERAAAVIQPTGIPFLDLCLLKGMFPHRMRQFCTSDLKVEPLEAFNLRMLSDGYNIEQWQGIRADESPKRGSYPDYEWGPRISVRRPILRWGVERVFEQHRRHGVNPNPLYSMGMRRVGCMPCINSGKDEIAEIARRFPEHIDRIREWESIVVGASKGGRSNFFHSSSGGFGIDAAVAWAQTSRGGRQFDWMRQAEPEQCSSQYGLCE